MGRLTLGQGLVVVACTLAWNGCGESAAQPAPEPPAERYMSPQGSDDGSCASEAQACRTWAYTYQRAEDRDRIMLLAGDHGALTVAPDPEHAPRVTLLAAGGAVVQDLTIATDDVTVRGLQAQAVSVDAGDQGVTTISRTRLVDMKSHTLWIRAARDVRVSGGSYGDVNDVPAVQIAAAPASRDVRFDGVLFHDARATKADIHTECMWAGGVDGLVIRRSTFRDCAYFDLFLTRLNGPDPRNVTLEQTTFGQTRDWQGNPQPFAINVANWVERAERYTLRGNTFDGDVVFQSPALAQVTLEGNRGAVHTCNEQIRYVRNQFGSGPCGPEDQARD